MGGGKAFFNFIYSIVSHNSMSLAHETNPLLYFFFTSCNLSYESLQTTHQKVKFLWDNKAQKNIKIKQVHWVNVRLSLILTNTKL